MVFDAEAVALKRTECLLIGKIEGHIGDIVDEVDGRSRKIPLQLDRILQKIAQFRDAVDDVVGGFGHIDRAVIEGFGGMIAVVLIGDDFDVVIGGIAALGFFGIRNEKLRVVGDRFVAA